MSTATGAAVVRPPTPMALGQYRRDFTPDLEAGPREPVYAVGLVSPKGVPFVLVREAVGRDHVGHMIAWFLWRDADCVGYLGASLPTDPFTGGAPLPSTRALDVKRSVDIWRSHIADGSGLGMGQTLARTPSRGLGLGSAAYVEIIRQLSLHGWALRSKPSARSADAKALWKRIREAPGVELVRRRPNGVMLEFAVMLAGTPALRAPGPVIAP